MALSALLLRSERIVMVTYTKGEPGPILAQSKVAEAHAGGKTAQGPNGLIQAHNPAWGVFALSGEHAGKGLPQSGEPLPELSETDYRNAVAELFSAEGSMEDDDADDGSAFLFGEPEDNLLTGSSAGDLVFGHGGTDYIVLGAGGEILGRGAGEDVTDSAGHGLLFGDLGFEDLFDGDDADVLGALDAVNIVDDGEGEEIFAFGAPTDLHDEVIQVFQAGDMVDLSKSGVFELESRQAHTAPGRIVAAHDAREVGEGAAIPGDPAGHDATDLSSNPADTQMLNGKDFNF